MGYYLNPANGQDKYEWLKENAIQITEKEFMDEPAKGTVHVCLVHNGAFTAAAIGWCIQERRTFTDPRDHRPKIFFMVNTEGLGPHCQLPQEVVDSW